MSAPSSGAPERDPRDPAPASTSCSAETRDDDERADARADDAAGQAHRGALEQELGGDVAPAGAERAAQADLADALEHRDERDVGDADRADEQRHAAEQQEQRVEVVLDRAAQLARVRRRGDLEQARVARAERDRGLAGDQVDRADARLDLGERRAPRRPNSRRAVPSGMIAAPSSDGLPADAGEQADHRVEAVADEDRRLLVDPRDAEAPRGVRARARARGRRARECPASKQPPAGQLGPHGAEEPRATRPSSAAASRPAASGSLIGTERTSAPRTSTSASVPAATTPLSRRRRASASQGRTDAAGAAARGPTG